MRRTWRVHPLVQSVTRVRAVLNRIVPISFLGADGGSGFGRGGGPGGGPGGFALTYATVPLSGPPVRWRLGGPALENKAGSCV